MWSDDLSKVAKFSLVKPVDFSNLNNLNRRFQEHTLFVPFADTGETGVVKIVQDVLSRLLTILTNVYVEREVRYDATWKSGLVLRKLIYGRPLSLLIHQEINHQRDFIDFAPHNSASATYPPQLDQV